MLNSLYIIFNELENNMPCWDYPTNGSGTQYINRVNPLDGLVYNLAMWNVLLSAEVGNRAHPVPSICYTILNGSIENCYTKTRLGALTETLCRGLTKYTTGSSSGGKVFLDKWPKLTTWWVNHQKQDAKVKADAKAKAIRDRRRKEALSKLSDDELKALGVSR